MNRKAKDDDVLHGEVQCVVENGEPAIYVLINGVRVAKRGDPDGPQARSWISLDPELVVRDIMRRGKPVGLSIEPCAAPRAH
jgi:hypothetical protein